MAIRLPKLTVKQGMAACAVILSITALLGVQIYRRSVNPYAWLKNCRMETFTSLGLGFNVDYKTCDGDDSPTVRAVGNTLYLVKNRDAKNPVKFGKPMIDTFNKTAEESVEDAIAKQFGLHVTNKQDIVYHPKESLKRYLYARRGGIFDYAFDAQSIKLLPDDQVDVFRQQQEARKAKAK